MSNTYNSWYTLIWDDKSTGVENRVKTEQDIIDQFVRWKQETGPGTFFMIRNQVHKVYLLIMSERDIRKKGKFTLKAYLRPRFGLDRPELLMMLFKHCSSVGKEPNL